MHKTSNDYKINHIYCFPMLLLIPYSEGFYAEIVHSDIPSEYVIDPPIGVKVGVEVEQSWYER